MVLGVGDGKIDIVTDRTSYHLGDTVKGRVTLHLDVPKHARELRIRLWGERKYPTSLTYRRIEFVYDKTLTLDGEKEYGTREYAFEMLLPGMIAASQAHWGFWFSPLWEYLAVLFGLISRPKWYLQATLDLRLSFDVNKKIQLDIKDGL